MARQYVYAYIHILCLQLLLNNSNDSPGRRSLTNCRATLAGQYVYTHLYIWLLLTYYNDIVGRLTNMFCRALCGITLFACNMYGRSRRPIFCSTCSAFDIGTYMNDRTMAAVKQKLTNVNAEIPVVEGK